MVEMKGSLMAALLADYWVEKKEYMLVSLMVERLVDRMVVMMVEWLVDD